MNPLNILKAIGSVGGTAVHALSQNPTEEEKKGMHHHGKDVNNFSKYKNGKKNGKR